MNPSIIVFIISSILFLVIGVFLGSKMTKPIIKKTYHAVDPTDDALAMQEFIKMSKGKIVPIDKIEKELYHTEKDRLEDDDG